MGRTKILFQGSKVAVTLVACFIVSAEKSQQVYYYLMAIQSPAPPVPQTRRLPRHCSHAPKSPDEDMAETCWLFNDDLATKKVDFPAFRASTYFCVMFSLTVPWNTFNSPGAALQITATGDDKKGSCSQRQSYRDPDPHHLSRIKLP